MSRRVEMGLEPPGSNRRMPQDYAIVCKKRQVPNYRSTAGTGGQSQPKNSPSVSPVLKVTGGQEGRAVSHKEPNSPFALKVAKSSKGNQSTPICRVSRITTVPSIVEGNHEAEASNRVAVISPVKPPVGKRLRVELTRYDTDNPVAPVEAASKKAKLTPPSQANPHDRVGFTLYQGESRESCSRWSGL